MIIFGNFITILLRRSTKNHPVFFYWIFGWYIFCIKIYTFYFLNKVKNKKVIQKIQLAWSLHPSKLLARCTRHSTSRRSRKERQYQREHVSTFSKCVWVRTLWLVAVECWKMFVHVRSNAFRSCRCLCATGGMTGVGSAVAWSLVNTLWKWALRMLATSTLSDVSTWSLLSMLLIESRLITCRLM